MKTEFSELGLHPQLVQAVAERGYASPTPIQSAVIPLMLAGHDVIGQAQTGTGKTAAFALPLLHALQPDQGHVQALVVAPTRELAQQVARAVYEYGKHRNVSVLPIYGGQSYDRQIRRLQNGVDVVVGTPGRLLDLMARKVLDISRVRAVVLDEADEMLSMGFIEDIEAILRETPASRQTALFSATLPPAIRRLADKYLHNPQAAAVQHEQLTVAAIEQRYYLVNEADKLAALTRLFEVEDVTSALIFAGTRARTGELAAALSMRGFPAEVLNGELGQSAREQVLNRFRRNQCTVLVATDVAARGLDIDNISHVFNFDLPQDPEVYVHRIGRTGRAGKTGVAITLITPREQWRLRQIEKLTKQTIPSAVLPTEEEIHAYREAQLVERMLVWLRRGRCQREREIVTELVESGHDPLEIAAAALKMGRAEEKQRPIEPVSEVREESVQGHRRNGTQKGKSKGQLKGKNRQYASVSHENGMVRLSLNAGKMQGVRPNDVVGTIAAHADIPGRSIGKILIGDQQTLVDVPAQFAAQVLSNNGNYRIRKQRVSIEHA